MADTTNVTKYFPTSSETYVNNLSASISSEATTVPVNAANQYLDGDVVVLVVEPGTTNEAVFTGTKASSPDRFIDCVWTEGNRGVGHASGAPIVDFVTATHNNMTTKGILKFANQDGTLKADPIRNALGIVASTGAGWETFPYPISISAGDTLGGREYNLTVANQDVTPIISKGMRLRVPRTTTPPTQSGELNGTSQYAERAAGSVTGLTFTDDFTIEAWVKITEASRQTAGYIVSRLNSANTNGFGFYYEANGTINIIGRGSSARLWKTKSDAVPIDRWVHIAASLDMSAGVGKVYIDGKEVASENSNATGTSLVQSGDLIIGTRNGSLNTVFKGKVAEVRIWNTIRTAQEIRDNMNQQLVGNETNLVGYWKLNGDWNDSTANANHLTPISGAIFATDAPFNAIEYANITEAPTFNGTNSILKVYSGNESAIPNETLGNADYSAQQAPYKLPEDLQANATPYDTGWLPIQVAAGKSDISITEYPMARKIGNVVYLRGGFSNSGMSASSHNVMGYLPDGFAPTENHLTFMGSSVGTVTNTTFIQSDGQIIIRAATLGSYYKFGGQSYLVD